MKTFKQRVIDLLRSQDWYIQYPHSESCIDFLSVRQEAHMKKAYRVRAHGHLSHKDQNALYEYGKRTGIHVLYVHEVAGREIEFIRLYPRALKESGV